MLQILLLRTLDPQMHEAAAACAMAISWSWSFKESSEDDKCLLLSPSPSSSVGDKRWSRSRSARDGQVTEWHEAQSLKYEVEWSLKVGDRGDI